MPLPCIQSLLSMHNNLQQEQAATSVQGDIWPWDKYSGPLPMQISSRRGICRYTVPCTQRLLYEHSYRAIPDHVVLHRATAILMSIVAAATSTPASWRCEQVAYKCTLPKLLGGHCSTWLFASITFGSSAANGGQWTLPRSFLGTTPPTAVGASQAWVCQLPYIFVTMASGTGMTDSSWGTSSS